MMLSIIDSDCFLDETLPQNYSFSTGPILNTAKNAREQGTTRDPFAIRVRVRAACLSSVIVIMSLEAK